MVGKRPGGGDGDFFGLLGKFFGNGGTTLLIKGAPGTGKTTLALSLALTLRPTTIKYISTRVSEEHVEKQFPWLRRELPETHIEDIRLGRPEFLVEKFLDGIKRPDSLLIVDSWDSFGNLLPREEALKTESALVHLSSAPVGGAKVVFVSERVELSPLDYSVDGVVQTEMEISGGRMLRRLRVLKLRGTRVERPVHLFSIVGSKTVMARPSVRPPQRFGGLGRHEDHYTLGFRGLDRVFGAPKFGETVAYDIGPDVPNELRATLSAAALTGFLADGGGAVVVLRLIDPVKVLGSLRQEGAEGRVRFFVPARNVEDGFLRPIPDSILQFEALLEKEIEEVRARSVSGKVLVLLSEAIFSHKFSASEPELYRLIYKLVAQAYTKKDAAIYVGTPVSGLSEKVYVLVDKHICVRMVDGTPLVYGTKPHTPFHFMDNRNGKLRLVEVT